MFRTILFFTLAVVYLNQLEASPISVAGSTRCKWFGNSGCKYSCIAMGHDSGACNENKDCICSEKELGLITDIKGWFDENVDLAVIEENLRTKFNEIKGTVTDWAESEDIRAMVPSKCAVGPGFCDTACRAVGRVDGTCNADNTDCTCNDKWVTPNQYALCVSETICTLDCQRRGKATGSCRKSGGWDCECDTRH